MSNEHTERRESLLNVTPGRRRVYVVAFTLFSLLGYAVVIWHHIADGARAVGAGCMPAAADPSAAATAESYMTGFAIAHAAALGMSLVATEIAGGIMVLADYLRVKLVDPLREGLRAEGRVEGRAEGRVEGRAEGRVEGRAEGHVEGRVEGRAEGRVEGRAEAHSIWREWNRRRREAEARGEAFDEPEPDDDE